MVPSKQLGCADRVAINAFPELTVIDYYSERLILHIEREDTAWTQLPSENSIHLDDDLGHLKLALVHAPKHYFAISTGRVERLLHGHKQVDSSIMLFQLPLASRRLFPQVDIACFRSTHYFRLERVCHSSLWLIRRIAIRRSKVALVAFQVSSLLCPEFEMLLATSNKSTLSTPGYSTNWRFIDFSSAKQSIRLPIVNSQGMVIVHANC